MSEPGYHAENHPRHVDRKALYTDLEARIDYLQRFLDFNADDVATLVRGAKYVKALAPTVVDKVYVKLLEFDITARVFRTRNTAIEEEPDDYPTLNSPAVQRRRQFLRWYMTKLCSDPTKPEFWRYLNQVGRMHYGKERLHSLNVEYIHIGACLGFIQDIVMEAVLTYEKLTLPFRIALVRALGKVIWIQNDLFARWRLHDGEEFEEEIETSHKQQEAAPQVTPKPSSTYLRADGSSCVKTSTASSTSSSEFASLFSETSSLETTPSPPTISAPTQYAQRSACPFSNGPKQGVETKVWSSAWNSGSVGSGGTRR
ncbi:protoglobin family protein [Aspergillus vadensis CBS 113365]|uniref:Globin-sensor domain-containing protein n=1 Tax=Aspergillus vadensis (strain CBS 113365 / IMI 142717 / IBT 24658) TaxID=1448311 RepID=A0A319BFH4_ASPVC|nr:hypothetical protein BO88DRAFT_35807 [Aspergillus vadensis CBS 113365]PYH69550.1 hypothetical protein BO88DRAFT_35807 [Aspergillus vadensis CBS 113365]